MRDKRGIWPIALVAVLVAALMVVVFLPQIPLAAPDNPVHSKGTITKNHEQLVYCEATVTYQAGGMNYDRPAYQLGACIHNAGTRVEVTYNRKKPSQAVVKLPVSPIEIAVLIMAFMLVVLLTLRVFVTEKKRQQNQEPPAQD